MSFALALLLLLAQETTTATTTTAPPPKPKPKVESDLVKASRAAKAKKLASPSTKKPITNADLKKAKSKLVTYEPPAPAAATDTTASSAPADAKGPLTKDDERYRARKDAEDRVNAATAKTRDLEKELDRVEQSYYNTNDPNDRDTVIAKRFAQTKKQLEDARKELADARDALAALK
ncbi:MAG TPA: hypothetical protein VH087_09190 [Thermoanaerobaculia bacterium]|nr:hypothetical protein [Thermoanaerobaculia bacterium]